MLVRAGIWLAVIAGVVLLASAVWIYLAPADGGADLVLRGTVAAERSSRWAILGVLGALLGNVLLFLNLRIAAQATDAANVAALAAKEAVDHARRTSTLELRPYVYLDNCNFNRSTSDGRITRTGICVTWKNMGRTPASNVMTHLAFRVEKPDFDIRQFHFPEHPGWLSSAGQIGPDSSIYTFSYFTIPVEDFVGVLNKDRTIILWASVEYDGLTPGTRHRTEWASSVVVEGDPTDPETQYSSRLLRRHNGYDEACVYRGRSAAEKIMPAIPAPQE